jgi:hypothetical protein
LAPWEKSNARLGRPFPTILLSFWEFRGKGIHRHSSAGLSFLALSPDRVSIPGDSQASPSREIQAEKKPTEQRFAIPRILSISLGFYLNFAHECHSRHPSFSMTVKTKHEKAK